MTGELSRKLYLVCCKLESVNKIFLWGFIPYPCGETKNKFSYQSTKLRLLAIGREHYRCQQAGTVTAVQPSYPVTCHGGPALPTMKSSIHFYSRKLVPDSMVPVLMKWIIHLHYHVSILSEFMLCKNNFKIKFKTLQPDYYNYFALLPIYLPWVGTLWKGGIKSPTSFYYGIYFVCWEYMH